MQIAKTSFQWTKRSFIRDRGRVHEGKEITKQFDQVNGNQTNGLCVLRLIGSGWKLGFIEKTRSYDFEVYVRVELATTDIGDESFGQLDLVFYHADV